MPRYRRTNPTIAMAQLVEQALRVQRWANTEGTAQQKAICADMVKAIVYVSKYIATTPINVVPRDNLSVSVNQQTYQPPTPHWYGVVAYKQGKGFAENKYPYGTPEYYQWQEGYKSVSSADNSTTNSEGNNE